MDLFQIGARPPLFFMHIPKTAGMSMRLYLSEQYPVHEICPAARWQGLLGREPELRSFPLVQGHFRYNLRELVATDAPAQVFSKAAGLRLAAVTLLIPHGVISWNLRVPGRVETSNNLGTIRPTSNGVQLMSTITSAVTSRKHELYNRVRSLVGAVGGGVTMEMFGLDAPEFPYRPDSELLAVASAAYRDVLGSEPNVEVSQCSLELGMFSRRVPVADIISIGTELQGLHSPAEKVNYKSVERVWPLVKEVVSRL